jgi:Fe-S-cluster containining protein
MAVWTTNVIIRATLPHMTTSYRALSALKHDCLACGGSCHGVRVSLLDDDERQRIAQYGETLKVKDPIDGRHLRQQDGHCVFQGDDGLCRIHATWGLMAKPLVCRQYPLIGVRTESGVRIGIDPGCYTAYKTRNSGTDQQPGEDFSTLSQSIDEQFIPVERGVLGLLSRPGIDIGLLFRALLGSGPGEGLPEGLASRWVRHLQTAGIDTCLAQEDAGKALRNALQPLLTTLPQWNGDEPPPWNALGAEENAWAVEVARRMIWLRLMPRWPSADVVCILVFLGAITQHWCGLQGEDFGRALSAWTRALRAPAFMRALAPAPESLLSVIQPPNA